MKIYDENQDELNSKTYRFDDQSLIRKNIGDKVARAMEKSFPLEWGGVRLEVKNIRYEPKDYTLAEQKNFLLNDQYLFNSLKGDLYLYDSKTNELLDEKKNKSLMRVPYYTQRGTFIHNGNEYSTLRQLRLRPGMYTRKKANGELETQFNIERGTGQGYRIIMDPATGIYKFNIGQSNSNLYSLLHDMGVPDQDLINAWGIDIFKRNKAKYDARALEKVHSKLVGKKSKATNRTEMAMELKNAFDTQRVDADIKQFNLGL